MFSIRLNSVVRLAFAATLASAPTILPAQFWRASSGGCNCGGPAPMAQMSAPVSMAAASFDATPGCQCYTPAPAPVTTAVVQACPQYMQPIHQTMYRDVPVTQYRPVKKMATRQVMKTKMVDKPVTTYKQVVETKMQEVPTTTYQTITEMKQVVNNRSHWQTTMQPVPKMSACQYDPRQGMLGSMNRSAYNFRQAFTPDNIPRKEFVPQVCVCNVPTQRTVAVPTTRQVAYQTTRLEPVTVMQQVATYVPETVEEEVTVMEPYTVTKTMAVGHSTTWAFVNPGTTATADGNPTPAKTAEGKGNFGYDNGAVKQNSFRSHSGDSFNVIPVQPQPATEPTPAKESAPIPAPPKVASRFTPAEAPGAVRVAGWRAYRGDKAEAPKSGPQLSVATNP